MNQTNYSYTVNTSDKSKETTLILCIFLGIFGVHNFYVGRYGRGIVFLFTLGGLGFGWLIDILTIAGGYFKDGNGAPIKITPEKHTYYGNDGELINGPRIRTKKQRANLQSVNGEQGQSINISDGKLIAILVGGFLFFLFLILVVFPSL